MPVYHEFAPPPRLAKHVECFWFSRPLPGETDHRVLPDGCTDIVFFETGGQVRGSVVGAMTRPILTPSPALGGAVFGVRFNPGMAHGLLRAPVGSLTDLMVELESLWGKDGRALEQRLGDANSSIERIAVLASAVDPPENETPIQRAALWVTQNFGNASPDEMARHAGLSARQFRRLCIEQAGVGPKMLCRILRFRRAAGAVTQNSRWAGFAIDHGYYDQAHFINDFREFSGLTPGEYVTVFSNIPPADQP